jgi:hypothetical protein
MHFVFETKRGSITRAKEKGTIERDENKKEYTHYGGNNMAMLAIHAAAKPAVG